MGRFEPDDAENLGLIPRQDVRNIERQQRGLHSLGFTESRWPPSGRAPSATCTWSWIATWPVER